MSTDGNVGHNWAIHNLLTACDWSPHNRVAHFFVGGVNAHASHHLFPRVSHAHYRAIAGIVEGTAAEFGVPYNKLTLPGIIRSHFRFLRKMGQCPGLGVTGLRQQPGELVFGLRTRSTYTEFS